MAATDATCSGFVTSRKRRHLTNEELQMIKNVYEGIRARQNISTTETVDICSSLTKVCVNTVYRAVKYEEEKTSAKKKKTETRGRKKIVVDQDNSNRKIYYLDKTWVNEGRTISDIKKIFSVRHSDSGIVTVIGYRIKFVWLVSHICIVKACMTIKSSWEGLNGDEKIWISNPRLAE
ncbi:hypothetical protein NQ317_007336 [Molorchus minor]|uniref:Transposase n=1 Tax=Molorchus minor TaxID=1323400 RepID=A0ABQ9J3E3_9CUCU|nr:hypothetical protein NQ317_007336 [Molorchus minor]